MDETGAAGGRADVRDATGRDTQPPSYHSSDLFQGGRVVRIIHDGRDYWLRITSAGKLILTA